ncbi:MAG TPA: HEAT repeat domain-containing protein [Kofleriaceae bacterium]|jgi:HEAT repeat protein|nr:HEAT repeat domain-containing protein [Kofleriaceae bacterium]
MVFGLFSKERALQRTIEKATNKLAQQPDRWGALEKLREDGTEDALFGLCKRWSVTSLKGVEDEQEKAWVVDILIEKGSAVLAPLIRYMKTADQLSFALQVLDKVADHDKQLAVVDELLATEPPGYVRMPDRRIDLIKWFGEHKGMSDDDVIPRLAPYLADFDENSRFGAIEGLANHDPARIVNPLIDALIRPEEESGRIRRTVVEALERTKAPLGERASAVANMLTGQLAQDFKVDGGVVKKK